MCVCVCVCVCAKMILCTMHIQCDLISLCSYNGLIYAFCGLTLLIFLIIQVKVYSGHEELKKRFPLLAAVNRCAQR